MEPLLWPCIHYRNHFLMWPSSPKGSSRRRLLSVCLLPPSNLLPSTRIFLSSSTRTDEFISPTIFKKEKNMSWWLQQPEGFGGIVSMTGCLSLGLFRKHHPCASS